MAQANLAEKQTTTVAKKTPKQNLKFMRDRDREKVKGIFNFYEVPGGTLKFPFKIYKWDDVERYELTDGETYTLPLGVAKHLNKNGSYPVHAHAVDAAGKPTYKIGQKKRRFGFQSLEFIDPDDFDSVDSGIITVENITKGA